MRACPKCGEKFSDEYYYCTECGVRLKDSGEVEGVKAARSGALPRRGRWGVRAIRNKIRVVWESFLVLFGLGLLISSFLLACNQMGIVPTAENIWSMGTLIALGVTVTFIGLRGAIDRVRALGGTTFGASGLGLLVFSFLKTYELMGQTPESANLVWLLVMITIGGFLTLRGIPVMRELGVRDRKTWGSMFVAFGLIALFLSTLTIYGQIGETPRSENVTWPFIMMFLGTFLFLKGFPLVREPKDNIRTVWESGSLAIGILAAILLVRAAVDLNSGTSELLTNTWVWMIILFLICVVLLAKGIELVRGERDRKGFHWRPSHQSLPPSVFSRIGIGLMSTLFGEG